MKNNTNNTNTNVMNNTNLETACKNYLASLNTNLVFVSYNLRNNVIIDITYREISGKVVTIPFPYKLVMKYAKRYVWTITSYDAASGIEVLETHEDAGAAERDFTKHRRLLFDAMLESGCLFHITANRSDYFTLVTDNDNEVFELRLTKSEVE